jgi:hypothetical protein
MQSYGLRNRDDLMTRVLYRLLIYLHPARFRRRFGDEMLWIFDERNGNRELLADILLSLFRQWFLRTRLWIVPVSLIGGLGPLALTSITGRISHRLLALAAAQSQYAFFFLAVAASLCAIVLTLVSCVAFFQISRRRRHA